jgi:very-short-patch-repair endonuclease
VEIGRYIVEFFCRECRVIVEIDGVAHGETFEVTADKRRSEYLETKGYIVFRACNNEVHDNLDGVLTALLQILEDRTR